MLSMFFRSGNFPNRMSILQMIVPMTLLVLSGLMKQNNVNYRLQGSVYKARSETHIKRQAALHDCRPRLLGYKDT
jgi:hypothetical protein